MRWPWPWPNDLDTQTWPRYGQDVPPYQNDVSMSTGSKVIAQTNTHTRGQTHTDKHTDRHTDTMKTLPLPHTREVMTVFTLLQRWDAIWIGMIIVWINEIWQKNIYGSKICICTCKVWVVDDCYKYIFIDETRYSHDFREETTMYLQRTEETSIPGSGNVLHCD